MSFLLFVRHAALPQLDHVQITPSPWNAAISKWCDLVQYAKNRAVRSRDNTVDVPLRDTIAAVKVVRSREGIVDVASDAPRVGDGHAPAMHEVITPIAQVEEHIASSCLQRIRHDVDAIERHRWRVHATHVIARIILQHVNAPFGETFRMFSFMIKRSSLSRLVGFERYECRTCRTSRMSFRQRCYTSRTSDFENEVCRRDISSHREIC